MMTSIVNIISKSLIMGFVLLKYTGELSDIQDIKMSGTLSPRGWATGFRAVHGLCLVRVTLSW
ncbi:MAG: hypothetical protein JWP09_463 [Candidatus Taylorbacteria bacterium]|nr:hypothetical protein [Candidatus Taylorbacteria bacterium]